MKELVSEYILKELKNRNSRNHETELFLNEGLIDVKIDGEEYRGLTTQEVVKRFGTNYYIIQNLRNLFKDEEIEQIIKQEQSVKNEVIDIFIKTLQQNNIFEGKLSIEEIRTRLEENIDAAYIVNEGYREELRRILEPAKQKLICTFTRKLKSGRIESRGIKRRY